MRKGELGDGREVWERSKASAAYYRYLDRACGTLGKTSRLESKKAEADLEAGPGSRQRGRRY